MAVRWLHSMRLRSLIASALSGISVLAILALLAFLLLTARAREEAQRQTDQLLAEEDVAERLIGRVHYQLHLAEAYAAAPSAYLEQRWQETSDEVHARLRAYLFQRLSAEERQLVERIRETHARLELWVQPVFLGGDYPGETLDAALLRADLDHLVQLRRQQRAELAGRQAVLTRWFFAGALVLALLFVTATLLLLRVLERRFLRRVEAVSRAAARVGAGERGVRVPVEHADEMTVLARAFNTMAADLERTQQRAQRAERRYRTLIESVSAVIWEGDASTYACSYVSPQAERLLGYPLADWIDDPDIWRRVIHPEDYERVMAYSVRDTSEGRDHELEYRVITAAGAVRWVREAVHVQVDAFGRAHTLSGILIDVTASRLAAEALAASEERYRSLFDRVPMGLYRTTPAGEFLDANPTCVQLLGFPSREALLRHGVAGLLDPVARAAWVEGMAREQGVGEVLWEITRPDGSTLWARDSARAVRDADDNVLYYEGALKDISDRMAAEEALQRSEARFRSLIEEAWDGVLILSEEGTVQYQSPAIERILGYPPEEFLGRSPFDLVHPEDQAGVRESFVNVMTPRGHGRSVQFRCRHKDGSWRVLHVIGTNLMHEPAVRGVVVNMIDATTKRDLEQQLQQAQRLEAVGRLAGGIAHDFNNLLTGIGGYTELLAAELQERGLVRPELTEIRRSVDRAATLTRQLLAFSRRQVIQPQDIDLNEVIADLRTLLQRLIGENIELQAELGRGVWVHADRGQVEQVLVNLIVNARDAMPEGGTVHIGTERVRLDAAAAEALDLKEGGYAQLTVRDTGHGMSADVLARVFEPFFTTKEVGKGTGLGLATVYGIICQAGGSATAQSGPGEGAEFRILLPLIEHPEVAAPDPAAAPPARPGRERVLVVEDEPAVRGLAERVLQRQGYDVLVAGNGVEALAVMQRELEPVQLVVTDVVMPELGGPELVARLEQTHPELRVLYISGYPRESFGANGAVPVEVNFLEKPFTPQQLTRRVREVLDQPAALP